MTIIKIILTVFLCILFIIDCTIPILKAYFAKQGLNAMGSYFGNIMLILTRICVAIYLPISAFLIQEEVGYKSIALVYSNSLFIASICAIIYAINLEKSINLIQKIIRNLINKISIISQKFDSKMLTSNKDYKETNNNKPLSSKYIIYFNIVVLLSSMINGLGLTLPMTLAAKYTSNSLLYSQLGPFINSFSTLGTVLFVEGYLTIAYEKAITKPNIVYNLLSKLLLYKSVGFASSALILILI